MLLNGMPKSDRVSSLTLENFEGLKNQAEFFYNLEENKIFNNVNKKKKN